MSVTKAARKIRRVVADPARTFSVLSGRIARSRPILAKALARVSLTLQRKPAEIWLRRGELALLDHDLTATLRCLRSAVELQPTVSEIYGLGARLAGSEFPDAEFEQALSATISDKALRDMLVCLLRSPGAYHPSRFWLYFMIYNSFQIDTGGIENFKRTANNNYFTWTGSIHVEEQTKALEGLLGGPAVVGRIEASKPLEFSDEKWNSYRRFLTAQYAYAKSVDRQGILNVLEEPLRGNPIYLQIDGRRISQDLCHTTIELNSILANLPFGRDDAFTVYELGAGHGRIGRALLSLYPRARYVIIDIAPALHVSQWYLSSEMTDSPIFRFRDFSDYADVRAEFEAARIAFLLPHQAELLPDKSADLFVNICSIQEMTREHVGLWFDHIERLCRGRFYTKQYLTHENGIDGITISRADYPARSTWKALFDRGCEAFPSLFEAMYALPDALQQT